MNQFFMMLRLQALLLLYLLAGVYIRKRNIIPQEGGGYFCEFIMRITLPCMIFSSFKPEHGPEVLLSAIWILPVAFAVCLCSYGLGKFLFRHQQPHRRSVLVYGMLVSNAGFAGLPQLQEAYGEVGLLYGSLYLIPIRILMWTVGISLFLHTDGKTRAKHVLTNPGILAVGAGLLRMLLRIPLPHVLETAIATLGSCTTPLAMIFIGMLVANTSWRTVWDRDTLGLALLRLLLVPLGILAVFRVFCPDPLLMGVTVLLTAMPVGVNAPIVAQKYGGDSQLASNSVLLTTVLSLLTLPLISLFL